MEGIKKVRIPDHVAALMLATSFFYDTLQALFNLLPALGQVISYFIFFISFLTFPVLWFHIRNVRFFESLIGKGLGKKIMKLACPVVEIVTLGVAPGITIFVAITIFQTRLDDKLVEKGVVTEEQLDSLDRNVRTAYRLNRLTGGGPSGPRGQGRPVVDGLKKAA